MIPDYICSIQHYNKYNSKYTFTLTQQWYNLKFNSFEEYQEFQMQLVYLMGEAKKKWEEAELERHVGMQETLSID